MRKSNGGLTAAELKLAIAEERKDCERALLALAGWFPTPAEGYGCNTSWAGDPLAPLKYAAAAMTKLSLVALRRASREKGDGK